MNIDLTNKWNRRFFGEKLTSVDGCGFIRLALWRCVMWFTVLKLAIMAVIGIGVLIALRYVLDPIFRIDEHGNVTEMLDHTMMLESVVGTGFWSCYMQAAAGLGALVMIATLAAIAAGVGAAACHFTLIPLVKMLTRPPSQPFSLISTAVHSKLQRFCPEMTYDIGPLTGLRKGIPLLVSYADGTTTTYSFIGSPEMIGNDVIEFKATDGLRLRWFGYRVSSNSFTERHKSRLADTRVTIKLATDN